MQTPDPSLEDRIKEVLASYNCHNCGCPINTGHTSSMSSVSRASALSNSNYASTNCQDKLIKPSPGDPLRSNQSKKPVITFEMIRPIEIEGDSAIESFRTSVDPNIFVFSDAGTDKIITPRTLQSPTTSCSGIVIPLGNGETVISHGNGIKKFQNSFEYSQITNLSDRTPQYPTKQLIKPKTTIKSQRNINLNPPKKKTPSKVTQRSSSCREPNKIAQVSIHIKDLMTSASPSIPGPITDIPVPHSKETTSKTYHPTNTKVAQINLVTEIKRKRPDFPASNMNDYIAKPLDYFAIPEKSKFNASEEKALKDLIDFSDE